MDLLARDMSLEILPSFSRADASEWSKLPRGDFVFSDLRFLKALEDSGSLGERTGWHPLIVSLRDGQGLAGVLPLFLKTNSYGEYIFDWAWAQASERAGYAYYPKLVSAIPFTPATGSKFLVRDESSRHLLLQAARTLVGESEASSLHFFFTPKDETELLQAEGLHERHSYQFHWCNNEGWKTFDDFLNALRSKRRAEIRRERATVKNSSIEIECLTGDDLKPHHAGLMRMFYESTIEKMGGIPYLSEDFFEACISTMSDTIVFFLAKDGGRPVAGALNFREPKGKTLFGRYWGSLDEYRNLHFELCYYAAIDYCLREDVTLFEAGAQGEHKFNRGFTPRLTYSAHEFKEEAMTSAIRPFLTREKLAIRSLFDDYEAHDPFKRNSTKGNPE